MDRQSHKKASVATVSKITNGVANMNVAKKPAANDKYAVGRARMQKLLQNGAFSNLPNPMTKFPRLVLAGATKKASTTVANRTPAAAKPTPSAPAVVSKTGAVPTKKAAPVAASKASVKKG